jgi:DNA-binding transcriptional LysR family regulator
MINLSRFDLVSLRIFVAVVEAGSLTGGARRFGISLAAASRRVVELEGETGTALLDRSKKGVVPTPAGQTLYRHSLRVVGDLENLAVAMGDYGRGVRAHVRLWANTSAVNGFLVEPLARYLAEHPTTKVDLEEALSDAVVRAVAGGAADLGIFADNIPAAGLVTATCDTDELVLLLPSGHPLAGRRRVRFAEALDHDFIGLERTSSLLRLLGASAAALGRPLRVRMQVRSFDAMCRMIASGIGIGVLPEAAARPHVRSMRLTQVRLNEPWATRRMLLGHRGIETLSAPARELADAILAHGRPAP